MATYLLILPLRLIQSALSQKAEAKPVDSFHRERSQGHAVMRGHEVASLPSGAGSHLGRSRGRASPFLAKSVLSASSSTGLVAADAVSGAPMAPVFHAITPRTRNVPLTDEVPRRLGDFGRRVIARYKPYAKGSRYASATGRVSHQPRPWGCQQRQSRGACSQLAGGACSERQNLRVPWVPVRFMGPVSPTGAATEWPGGTSSCQLVNSLSNSPQQPNPAPAAVRSR